MADEKVPALVGEAWRGVDGDGDLIAASDDGRRVWLWDETTWVEYHDAEMHAHVCREWARSLRAHVQGLERDVAKLNAEGVHAGIRVRAAQRERDEQRTRAEAAEARLGPVQEAARAYQAAAAELRMWGQRSGKSEALQAVVSAALATVAEEG